jgi:hypothetical protein
MLFELSLIIETTNTIFETYETFSVYLLF